LGKKRVGKGGRRRQVRKLEARRGGRLKWKIREEGVNKKERKKGGDNEVVGKEEKGRRSRRVRKLDMREKRKGRQMESLEEKGKKKGQEESRKGGRRRQARKLEARRGGRQK
jgi:hypothetical protein